MQASGEPTEFTFFEAPTPNADPVARFTTSRAGRTLTLDATGSTDADGHVVAYLWEFGDGSFATGPTVTHRYTEPGTYRVTLTVADDDDALGFAAGNEDIVVPKYEFAGFFEPVENAPALNKRNPGSAVPVKFRLDGAQGTAFFEAGYPRSQPIDCATREPQGEGEPLKANEWVFQELAGGVYQFKWKSNKDWKNVCRRLIVGFDDGSRHTADFWFK